MQKTVIKFSAVIFLLVALLHLARLVFQFDVIVAGTMIPLWVNVVGLVLSGGLSLALFKI